MLECVVATVPSILAVGASAVAHLLALFGTPRFDLGASIEDRPAPPPIEARIIPPPIPAPVVAPSKPAPDTRRATRRAAPPPLPLVQDAVVPQYDYPEGVMEAVATAAADGPAEISWPSCRRIGPSG